MRIILFLCLGITVMAILWGCASPDSQDERPYIVATTMMLEDAIKNIGGDIIRVEGLLGPGVDPHLYRATPGDFQKMEQADLIVYNGLYLEARLSEILGRMPDKSYAAAEIIPEYQLIEAFEFGGNYDPHVWFDVSLWTQTVEGLGRKLEDKLPEHAETLRANTEAFVAELDSLHHWVKEQIQSIPVERRVLISAHNAFRYFGRAYDIDDRGLQGLSTQSEVGLQDVRNMVLFIIERDIPAIFLETSIAPRSIQSLINGVNERGGRVELGGELYSDAMGERGTKEGTYTGMIRYNVNTIVNALK
jgi:manganese/zinc/iron transport system substrate-binding protein